MCPERHRGTVESVRRTLGQEKVSERRVCRVLGQNRGTQRHRPRKVDGDRELLGVMRKIVETFPRHGSERTHRVLTGPEAFGGWKVNIKRVHRIWKEEHMQVPQKQRKRRRLPGSSANGCVRHRALHRNHVWSYDFPTERTEDGRQLRIFVVIDEFTAAVCQVRPIPEPSYRLVQEIQPGHRCRIDETHASPKMRKAPFFRAFFIRPAGLEPATLGLEISGLAISQAPKKSRNMSLLTARQRLARAHPASRALLASPLTGWKKVPI